MKIIFIKIFKKKKQTKYNEQMMFMIEYIWNIFSGEMLKKKTNKLYENRNKQTYKRFELVIENLTVR